MVTIFTIPSLATALRCYTCNSNDNSECFAPPTNFTEELVRDNRTIPGRLLLECPKDPQGRKPLCRTIRLLVLGGSLPDHERIVRECGYERSRRPCYKVDNGGHEEHVCHCSTDGCNGGSQIAGCGVVLLALASTGLLLRSMQRDGW
uniref:Uncharacterized protein n=1 Tax=Anopheles epiroticus TaxID=199890 RepID=A0A182PMQ4_9DIPT